MVLGKIELIKKSHGQQRQHRKYKEEEAELGAFINLTRPHG